ncbi:hypothetical protein FDP41_000061 [Naegleria fowleri]|uniref:Transmembrane protein n=1 Tax=Naegleria fowleri TaxID=5763 RepID=A0A6A5CD54_NAEFO|nr:uncharacterized protein FDP41_000061 [Naegleria fowleri]KAF0985022.1 hypothetical protein FDP41_000061 [Naegleria fowleri]CAG4713331.1 unnamed protein product [Naegleria fowleri]
MLQSIRNRPKCLVNYFSSHFLLKGSNLARRRVAIIAANSFQNNNMNNTIHNNRYSSALLWNQTRSFSSSEQRLTKEENSDDPEQRLKNYQQDRKMAQEKMQNIKKELTDFLKLKFNTDKKQEKQAERMKLARNLGNIMIILGFIVGLVIYVGENEKKKRSDYIVEETNTNDERNATQTQNSSGNITAQQFLTAISSKVNKIKEENQKK